MISTSIIFSSNQIDLVQVDIASKKLINAISVALPVKTISRGKILNPEAVSQSIQTLLSKTKKLKKIIVVIPEDIVICKSISLPKLKKNEISEAVSWEAENFLPYHVDEVVLDWKRLESNGQNHVLFQAVEKKVLDVYVGILEKLGLEISVIESPALSLVRLAETKKGVRILIHINQSEAILTLSKDFEVIATSVVANTSGMDKQIKNTVNHMMMYYENFKTEWLQVAGPGVTNTILKTLSSLKLPIAGFSLPITANPEMANAYLLGISAAVREVAPPSDETSINLIPQWYVKKISKLNSYRFLNKFLIIFSIFSIFLVVLMGAANFYLNSQDRQIRKAQAGISSNSQKILEETKLTNSVSSTIINLAKEDNFPIDMIETIATASAQNITIYQINMNLSEHKGEIKAVAAGRDDMLLYKQKLETITGITQVNLPVSSFAKEKDIDFLIQFWLKVEEKKKKLKLDV